MSNIKTIEAFKAKQKKNKELLQELAQFIQKGKEFGLEADKEVIEKLKVASESISTLKVALIGGFSEGKTSIAAAWLEKLDETMQISQLESSDAVKIYKIDNDVELIDTPGLFGFKEKINDLGEIEKYKEITKKYVSEAHLVLYVMNSINPIKESHSEDLKWLFRDLNLLPRTIFVLSKFDDVSDIEDDQDYEENLKIKKENVISRLKTIINLTTQEQDSLKVVAVSANPFGEGTEYWLEHLDEFKKISYIHTLQKATQEMIENSGGASHILLDTQNTIIRGILTEQLPELEGKQNDLNRELSSLEKIVSDLKEEFNDVERRASESIVNLKEFVASYIASLITQLKGTQITTFGEFFERELGEDGIMLKTKIEVEISRQCGVINSSLKALQQDFNAKLVNFDSDDNVMLKQGIAILGKNKFDANQIKAARDGLVNIGKIVGLDLSKLLKFKPWGAVNLAAKANVALAAFNVAMELYDSYKKEEQEKEFNKIRQAVEMDLNEMRKSLLEKLNDSEFISQLFPQSGILKHQFNEIQDIKELRREEWEQFVKWHKKGEEIKEIIDAEYSVVE